MKLFFKIFVILVVSEIILGIAAVFLQQGVYIKSLNILGSVILYIISFPASLIDRAYPYYSPDPWYITLLVLIINFAIHTAIVYIVIRNRQEQKETSK